MKGMKAPQIPLGATVHVICYEEVRGKDVIGKVTAQEPWAGRLAVDGSWVCYENIIALVALPDPPQQLALAFE